MAKNVKLLEYCGYFFEYANFEIDIIEYKCL